MCGIASIMVTVINHNIFVGNIILEHCSTCVYSVYVTVDPPNDNIIQSFFRN